MILLSRVRFIHWYDIGDIMTGAACGRGNDYPSGAPDFTSGFHRGSCCSVICVSLFHVIVLSFGFWVMIVPFVWLFGIYIFYFQIMLKNDSKWLRKEIILHIHLGCNVFFILNLCFVTPSCKVFHIVHFVIFIIADFCSSKYRIINLERKWYEMESITCTRFAFRIL